MGFVTMKTKQNLHFVTYRKEYESEFEKLFRQACEKQFDIENISPHDEIFAIAEDFFFEGIEAALAVYFKNIDPNTFIKVEDISEL